MAARRGEPQSLSDQIAEALKVANQDRAFFELDNAGTLQILQVLVDAFPRPADQFAEGALRYLHGRQLGRSAVTVTVTIAVVVGKAHQHLGDPRFEIEERE